MTKVIKIAKTTRNVLTATNPNDFIFHSSYNTFKIIAQGVLTAQTIDANPKTITLAHGRSGVPGFYAFAQFPDGKAVMPDNHDFTEQFNVSLGYGQFTVEADATNLYFIFTKPSSNYNVDIKYYIFEVPI